MIPGLASMARFSLADDQFRNRAPRGADGFDAQPECPTRSSAQVTEAKPRDRRGSQVPGGALADV